MPVRQAGPKGDIRYSPFRGVGGKKKLIVILENINSLEKAANMGYL